VKEHGLWTVALEQIPAVPTESAVSWEGEVRVAYADWLIEKGEAEQAFNQFVKVTRYDLALTLAIVILLKLA